VYPIQNSWNVITDCSADVTLLASASTVGSVRNTKLDQYPTTPMTMQMMDICRRRLELIFKQEKRLAAGGPKIMEINMRLNQTIGMRKNTRDDGSILAQHNSVMLVLLP
jgi:hypothetical protein